MGDELDQAIAFFERMQEAMAKHARPWAFGTAFLDNALDRVWYLNFLRVNRDETVLSLDRLLDEAELVLGDAGLAHRKIEVNDERGAALEPGFRRLGWQVERALVMALRDGIEPAAAPALEVEAAALRGVWEQGIRESPFAEDEETVQQLVAGQLLRETATSVRYFAARADGQFVSECSLFSDGRTAQIESVRTLEAYRGRGFAQAVVTSAAREARASGHRLVFLCADDEDWPKELYRRLGFEPIGRVWEYVRVPTSARRERTSQASLDA